MGSGSTSSSVNTCSGAFYDSGGAGGNYANNSSATYTFCSNLPGQCITVDFTQFNVNDIVLGIPFDYLSVYDGPTTASPYMFDISGGPFPSSFPVSSSTGCLTFEFISDGSVRTSGWTGLISCQPCPIPTAPSQQDCNGSVPVCLEQYYQPYSYSGNNGSDIVPVTSCLLNGELNNSWYVFTAQTSGNLSFEISPNFTTDDYDWAVYDITNNGCEGISDGSSTEISCNYSSDVGTWAGQTGANSTAPYFGAGNSTSSTGQSFNASIPVTAGNSYAILISNFSASQGGYFIDLSPSTALLFDNVAPTLESLENTNCGGTSFQVEFSEPTLCSSIQVGDFSLIGPGGSYSITSISSSSCTGGGTQFTQEVTLNISPAISQAGIYTLCLTNTAGGISDLCGNTSTSGCLTFTSGAPTVFAHGTNPTCASLCNGTATVDVVGGTSPYTYSWSNGGNTQSISSLCAGTYTVTVTDANGCTASNFTPVSNCFQIQSILVNSCSTTEQNEEMVFFQVGNSTLNTSGFTATWPTLANTWRGICTNSAYITAANATITGGGVLLPLPVSGILPANANVVLITSNVLNTPIANFSNLSDTLYVIFQCSGNTQGHFGNSGASLSNPLVLNFGGGCTQSVNYTPNSLPNFGGSGDGGYVLYSSNGTPTYLNYGCTIPFTIQTSSVSLVSPAPVPIVVTPSAPIICSGANTILTASGATTYTWTPAVGLSATTGSSVTANPTLTTTYNVTGTLAGCTGTSSALVTVLTPTLPTLSPTVPCAGNAVNFTTSNGSFYEYTINGNSQGAPSTTNTFTSPVLAVGDQVCVKSYPTSPFVFEGNIIEPEWGNPLARSTGGPPASGFGAGNNLDALYVNSGGGFLNGAIASNLVNNSNNRILLFIDCQAGGFNSLSTWTLRNNSPYYSVENLNSAITFDPGFSADYVLAMNQASGNSFFDLYNMVSNSNNFIGNASASPFLGFVGNSGVGNFTQGFEFAIPLSAIGNPTGTIRFFCMLVNDPGFGVPTFISNQFLTPAGAGELNYGNGAINFGNAAPNPIQYSLSPDCFLQTCVTATTPVTPTFAPLAPFCSGLIAPNLPTTSINGITGTWLPNVINNTSSAPYIFTPNAGQCATTQTLNSTVLPIPTSTPIFHD
jgi:hypothetical protein